MLEKKFIEFTNGIILFFSQYSQIHSTAVKLSCGEYLVRLDSAKHSLNMPLLDKLFNAAGNRRRGLFIPDQKQLSYPNLGS